jgi:hypothetical protein
MPDSLINPLFHLGLLGVLYLTGYVYLRVKYRRVK